MAITGATIINNSHTRFRHRADAERIAASNNADDTGCTYEVIERGTPKRFVIMVIDNEDGSTLGPL